ncbi:MAG: spermidine/putrescine ABC transporter permease PotC, partial [Geminicoccaceae bacterium]
MAERTMTKPFSLKRQPGFTLIALTCFALLYAPILVLVVYSFNGGVSLAAWEGFSWRWYQSAWQNQQVQ